MKSDLSCDIIIVGGGLTGGLAALALSQSGFEVRVIEGQSPKTMNSSRFDGRTTAIAYASMRLFRRLGLWEAIADYAEPISDILVTDGKKQTRFSDGGLSSFHMHFDSHHLGSTPDASTPLGWIVENQAIRRAIFAKMNKTDLIHLHAPAMRVSSNFGQDQTNAGTASVNLDDGTHLTAPLILAADGKKSPLRMEAGIRVNHWQYPQMGLVATVSHEVPHEGFAQEYFLPGGPFAILPMTDTKQTSTHFPHRSSLVWTEKKPIARQIMSAKGAAFKTELTRRFGPYLGDLSVIGRAFSYPLSFHLSHEFAKPRLALLGDAARAIHPIAGQGFNLGVKDIAALNDVLVEARGIGLDIGHMSVLHQYQKWRRFDSTALALGTDILNKMFSNNLAPVRLLRDLGLGAVNTTTPLRKFFMRQAGADAGTLPSLMRP